MVARLAGGKSGQQCIEVTVVNDNRDFNLRESATENIRIIFMTTVKSVFTWRHARAGKPCWLQGRIIKLLLLNSDDAIKKWSD